MSKGFVFVIVSLLAVASWSQFTRDSDACLMDLQEIANNMKNLVKSAFSLDKDSIKNAVNEIKWNAAAAVDDCIKGGSIQLSSTGKKCFESVMAFLPDLQTITETKDDEFLNNIIVAVPQLADVAEQCVDAIAVTPAPQIEETDSQIPPLREMKKCLKHLLDLAKVLPKVYFDMQSYNFTALALHLSQAINIATMAWDECRGNNDGISPQCHDDIGKLISLLEVTLADARSSNWISVFFEMQKGTDLITKVVPECTNNKLKFPVDSQKFQQLLMTLVAKQLITPHLRPRK